MDTGHFRVWMRVLSLAAIVVVAATGLCLFHGTGHGSAGLDLCSGMIASTLGAVLRVNLHGSGRPSVIPRWTSTPATIGVPDPPPWAQTPV